MTAIGMVLWSIVLLASAMAGIYKAGYFGLIGWFITLFILKGLFKKKKSTIQESFKVSGWDWVLVAGFALTALLYLGFPTESIFLGRDEGLYANHAIYIAHHGRLDVPYPWPENLDPIFSNVFREVPGFFPNKSTMTVQFSHLFGVWLAQAFATFGHHALFRFEAMVALLFLCIFYGLCRSVMPKPYAVIATLFLALNPSEIWIARRTLTEILTQLFIWSGLFILLLAQENKSRKLARWAGVLLGFSSLVRIDSFFWVPLLFFSHLVQKMIESPGEKKSSSIWSPFYQIALPVFVLALGYYAFDSKIYLSVFSPLLKQIGLLTLAILFALLASTQVNLRLIRPLLTGRTLLVLIGIVLMALTIYAYWFRPNIEPYSTINAQEHFLHGTRNYRENSMVNLAKYLSPPVIFVAIWGWFVTLWAMIRKNRDLHLFVGMVCVSGFSALYLWSPSIAPDHFWAIRRFVPIVIPGFILFSALGMQWILNRFSKGWFIVASAVVIIFLSIFTVRANQLIFAFAEEKGYFLQLQQLAEKLPSDSLILAHCDRASVSYGWLMPLYLVFDRRTILIDLNSRGGMNAFYDWSEKQTREQKPVLLLYEGDIRFAGLPYTKMHEGVLSRSFSEQTPFPLPKKIRSEKRTIGIYKITGMINPSGYMNIDLGTEKIFGIRESGFYGQEFLDKMPIRWTNGAAKFVVPLSEKQMPKAIGLDIASPRGMKQKKLQILANGHKLFDGEIPNGKYFQSLSLANVPLWKQLTIELLSDTHIPREVRKGSTDVRTLGVLVKDIRLLDNDYIDKNLGNGKVLGVSELGWYEQEIWEKMPVRWTNGTAKLIIPLNEKRLPQGISVDIASTGGIKRKRVRILANGYKLFDGQIPKEEYSQSFSLANVPLGKQLTIELLSDKNIPAKTILGSTDERTLGVLVKDIRLLDNDYINVNLGNEKVVGVGESGFYGQEFSGKIPVRWTNGAAKLIVPVKETKLPNILAVDIGPTGTNKEKRLKILANGNKLFDGKLPNEGFSQSFSFANVPLGKQLTFELLSDTHTPGEAIKGSTDVRTLGLLVKDIRLLDNDYINKNIGNGKVLGVGESGWYEQELWEKTPVRWTNGAAKLIVPLNEKRLPKAIDVDIVATGGMKPKRLQILANGQKLFDGQIPDERYSQSFSLANVPLLKQLTIELLSDTHIPRETIKGSTDNRTLGVLVNDIRLLDNDSINITLGNQRVLGIGELGFYGQEFLDKIPVRWTNGAAKLIVPLKETRLPSVVMVDIGPTGIDKEKRFKILANDHMLFDGHIPNEGFSQSFSLFDVALGKRLTIELLSDTHIPKEVFKGSTDNRTLGVFVKDIRLLDNDYINVNLGTEKILGVDEWGFYGQEFLGKIPVRWTNGATKLVIPLNKKRMPQAIGLDIASIRGIKPKRLQILANGHKLFDREVSDSDIDEKEGYSQFFSLSQVPLGKQLTLELLSDTYTERKKFKGSIEDLPLGVMVKELRLLDDDYVDVSLGTKKVLGVAESGWHKQESWDKMPARWTDGTARLIVPLNGKRMPKAMGVEIVSTGGVKVQQKKLRILVNGYKLFDGQISNEGYCQLFPLPDVPLGKQLTIELLSDQHIPKNIVKGSIDERTLGVMVKDIKLLDKFPD